MEQEPSASVPSHKLTLIFYNERGLRAGWRLLIYIGIIWLLILGAGLIAKRLTSGHPGGAPSSEFVRTMIQAAVEFILFLVLLFLAWVMSKIERRNVGAYGLPLQRPALSGFI